MFYERRKSTTISVHLFFFQMCANLHFLQIANLDTHTCPLSICMFSSVFGFLFPLERKSRRTYASRFSQVCIDLRQKRFLDFLKLFRIRFKKNRKSRHTWENRDSAVDSLCKSRLVIWRKRNWTHLSKYRRTEIVKGFHPKKISPKVVIQFFCFIHVTSQWWKGPRLLFFQSYLYDLYLFQTVA